MVNRHRGEIEGCLNGKRYRLVLTLGALAELESAFGDEDMLALTSRFECGRLSARDCMRVIGAGLRGGGYDIGDDDVGAMQADGGATGFVDIVSRLLTATFSSAEANTDAVGANLKPAPTPQDQPTLREPEARPMGKGAGTDATVPFPGIP